MSDTTWQRFTIRMDELDAKWVRTAYELARKIRIEKGETPPSLNTFLVENLVQHFSNPEVIMEL